MAGYRIASSGSLNYIGFYGVYWSGTAGGAFARYLNFESSGAGMSSYYRAGGLSVRCLKHDTSD